MASEIWVNIGSGNGLLPDSTKHLTWTNIDRSLVKSSDIYIRAISKEMPQPSITKIGACGHMGERRLQRHWPPLAVMKTSEFSCTFMFNSSSKYSLNMGYIVMNFNLLFITAVPTAYQNARTVFCIYVNELCFSWPPVKKSFVFIM